MYSRLISLELSEACHNANIEVNFGWNLGARLYSKYSMNIPSCSIKIRNFYPHMIPASKVPYAFNITVSAESL